MDLANEAVILELLKLYENEPILWNPNHPLHKSRNAVNEGWKRIQAGLSITCSVEELKKKKESLMATYRPLARKVKQSKKSGVGANRVHKPSWFAYETMASFLTPVYNARLTMNNEEPEEDPLALKITRRQENLEDESTDAVIIPSDTGPDIANVGKKHKSQGPKEYRKRKLLKTDTIEARMTEAYEVMKNVSKKQTSKEKDICDLYTELLSAKLKDLDELTRTVVMNEIDNLVFRAKMQLQDSCPAGPSTSNGHHFLPSRYTRTYRSPSPQSSHSGSPSATSPHTVTLSPSATPPSFRSTQKQEADLNLS